MVNGLGGRFKMKVTFLFLGLNLVPEALKWYCFELWRKYVTMKNYM